MTPWEEAREKFRAAVTRWERRSLVALVLLAVVSAGIIAFNVYVWARGAETRWWNLVGAGLLAVCFHRNVVFYVRRRRDARELLRRVEER